ncbi:hypothetical protein Mapa_008306 [Marchantia paleacea]|nr:hypothetical protein Mapa_008306 [Marchantia paleacea]
MEAGNNKQMRDGWMDVLRDRQTDSPSFHWTRFCTSIRAKRSSRLSRGMDASGERNHPIWSFVAPVRHRY